MVESVSIENRQHIFDHYRERFNCIDIHRCRMRNVRMCNPSHRYDLEGECGPIDDPSVEWSHDIGAQVNQVAVWDDQVYCAGSDGSITAFDTNGDPQWRIKTDDRVRSSPAVVDGILYVGSADGCVYALDVDSGSQHWCFETDGPVNTSPAVVDGTVYVGSGDGNVYGLAADSGKERWRFKTTGKRSYRGEGKVESSPAIVDGSLYVGGTDGMYALDTVTGTEEWFFETDGWSKSPPTVVEGTIYFGCSDNHIYALDADEGNERWCFEIEWMDSPSLSPAIVDGILYIGSNDGHVYALDTVMGTEQWRFETDGDVRSSPAVVDSNLYVRTDNGHIYALHTKNGDERWHFEADGWLTSLLTVVDGTLYVGAADGTVCALEGAETEVFRGETEQTDTTTQIYQACSNCEADLSEYDDPQFCPECGTETTAGENALTEIYDP